ncbi:inositol monophosphatase [Actibacterium sp. 188UL27-1]|uniref:inositol monophosphatase family protein n=1 Tax=Actibacterium sp. 188UL27-1 TaxID=2786961 RepID=UPI0019597865|nr:inositol monophosphatase [Actibacterium sp. 188UL27-1]MBM7067416.1 inositol monophosphatase [Actibacterium sp. 188UL27-1]
MDLSPLPQDRIDALIDAVRHAAKAEILPRFRAMPPETVHAKTAPDDLVTEADLRTEARLTKAIADILPDAKVLGEEAVSDNPAVMQNVAAPGLCVIIDPVDGTWNFASGIAAFGTILAVTRDGHTIFGLLYDPLLDDWIMASAGGGAWYCRQGQPADRLQTSAVEPRLEDLTGYISLFLFRKDRQAKIAASFPAFRRILALRCSCHEYRTLASGRVDFNLNGMLMPWDHAAGALITTEAGGVVRMMDGRPYTPLIQDGYMMAANDEATWDAVHAHFADKIGM